MKKSFLKLTSIFLLAVIFTSCGPYDQAVLLQEEVDESWGNVSAAYQRRADLVPQLVATVKGAAGITEAKVATLGVGVVGEVVSRFEEREGNIG